MYTLLYDFIHVISVHVQLCACTQGLSYFVHVHNQYATNQLSTDDSLSVKEATFGFHSYSFHFWSS